MNRRRFLGLLPALVGGTVAAAKAGPVVRAVEIPLPKYVCASDVLRMRMQPYQKVFFTTTPRGDESAFYRQCFAESVRKSREMWEKMIVFGEDAE